MTKVNAEKFDDVLELARSRRHTGMVAIEHTQVGRVEEGEVFFQAGHPIYARVGRLVGQDALDLILKWGNIFYSIASDGPRQSVPTTTATYANNPGSLPPASATNSPRYANNSSGQVDGRNASSSNNFSPGIEWLVPQKRGIEREVLALPLTRRQRFIYFLVDGKRTVTDLSRCTGKNIQEIELILSELQAQGLVAI